MFSKIVLVYSVVLGSYLLAQSEAFRQPKCRGKETKLTQEELQVMGDCLKEFSAEGKSMAEIPKESIGCIGKCILQKQGMIDDSGTPIKDNIYTTVNATLDDEIAKEADERIGTCVDEKSSGIDVKECQTYSQFVECVAAAFMQICMANN